MYYVSHRIPPPLHPHMHTHAPTHPNTHTHSLATPRFPLSLLVSLQPKKKKKITKNAHTHTHTHIITTTENHQPASEDSSSKIKIRSSTASSACERVRVGRNKEKSFKRSSELWERTAVLGVSRKVVPDKGSLNREWPVNKVLKFPPCTKKRFFTWTGMECARQSAYRKTRWQVWWQGTIKNKQKSRYLKNNPVFDWQPVKYFVLNLLPHYWIHFLNLPFQPWRQTSDWSRCETRWWLTPITTLWQCFSFFSTSGSLSSSWKRFVCLIGQALWM